MNCMRNLFFICLMILSPFTARGDVCLNMIVKDEGATIRRCLESVKPLIDYWVIVDTGSSDGTQEIIRECLKEIPGELYEASWVNFGHNRTHALELAKTKGEYLLFIDGDDWLEYSEDYTFPPLTKGAYHMWRGSNNFSYLMPQLVRSDLAWKWVGVLHEYLACDVPYSSETLNGICYIQSGDGNRSKDPQKYQKHVKILETALQEEPDNPRYVFYLAESYRDAGDPKNAIDWYQKRVDMGGWNEEVYWSLLQIGKLKQAICSDPEEIIDAYYRAWRFRPQRPEASYYLSAFYNDLNRFDLAYATLKAQSFCPSTRDVLFNEEWIERWGLLFQLSMSAYYRGLYQESLDLCNQLLKISDIPENFRSQIRQNRSFPLQKLGIQEKTVLLAILARNKAHVLPTYLKHIEQLDYDKKLITVYINTNNNEDETQEILEEWIKKNSASYQKIVFESHDIPNLETTNPHEWTSQRWRKLGEIRNQSLKKTREYGCDYYFVVDCDVFLEPSTLTHLVSKDKPIIAPLLRALPNPGDPYSNFFADIDQNGYFKDHPDFFRILNREKIGTFKIPLVHIAYLIKQEVLDDLNYIDEDFTEWEFIQFAKSARKHGIDQYICNEKLFGSCIHLPKEVCLEEEEKIFKEKIVKELQENPLRGRLSFHDKRYATFRRAIQLMEERGARVLVETGTARGGENNFEGDGGSTIIFADWASKHDAYLYSVDIDKRAIEEAKQATTSFSKSVGLLQIDSVKLLQQFPGKIDFLYLDSFDFEVSNPKPSQEHHLKEIKAAYDKLTNQSVVMIDDCALPEGGKGKEVIAFLLDKGWIILEEGYQVIMVKDPEKSGLDTLKPSEKLAASVRHIKQLKQELRTSKEIVDAYLKIALDFPGYVEPLYYLCLYYHSKERYEEGFQVAKQGLQIETLPEDPLEPWVYEYGMLWEYSILAHATGRFEEALEATQCLLKQSNRSQEQQRVLRNNLFYFQAGKETFCYAKKKWGDFPWEQTPVPRLHVCTVATEKTKGLNQLLHSCAAHKIELEILGFGLPFSFSQKIQCMQDYLETIPEGDIVLFLDGYDTLVLADEKAILGRFLALNIPLVVSAETFCHPFWHLAPHYPQTASGRFKYLNSGGYIGYAGYIKNILKEITPLPNTTDDQGILTVFYLYHPHLLALDHNCNLFLTLFQVEEDQICIQDEKVRCIETGTFPCIIHGNTISKWLYQKIYDQIFSNH